MSSMPFKSGDRILFQGDSITDCGCRDTSNQNPLGTGYVAIIRGLLSERHPDLNVTILNRGVGGDRTPELLARWEEDVKPLKPTWLSIMIGVNDVWRKRKNPAQHIPLDAFIANYKQLIDRAKGFGVNHLVLMSPTVIDDDQDTDMNRLVAEYDEAVQHLARENHAVYVPARTKLIKAIQNAPTARWTSDGCHPTISGHAVIAQAWIEAIGA
jgi:lysophospholipase L1-like esterase